MMRENKALRIIGRFLLVTAPFGVYYLMARVHTYFAVLKANNDKIAEYRHMYPSWDDENLYGNLAQFKERKLAELAHPMFWSEHITASAWVFAALWTMCIIAILVAIYLVGGFILFGRDFLIDKPQPDYCCTNQNCKCIYHGADHFDTEHGKWVSQPCKTPHCGCGYHVDEWFDERGYEWTDRPQPPSGGGSSDNTALYAATIAASTVAAATMINNP